MLSGALLIEKEESLKNVFLKRVMKYGIILLIVSVGFFFSGVYKGTMEWNLRELVYTVYTSETSIHLWYLYSYIPLMLMLPLLRKMARGLSDAEYYYMLAMALLLYSFRPWLEQAFGIAGLNTNFYAPLFSSQALVYFLWGYFLEKRLPQKGLSKKMMALGACLTILVIIIVGNVVMPRNMDFQVWFMIIPVSIVYLAAKFFFTNRPIPNGVAKFISMAGSASFGVYLFEPVFRYGTSSVFNVVEPLLGEMSAYLIWSVCAVLLGTAVVTVMKKIPILKWLVT